MESKKKQLKENRPEEKNEKSGSIKKMKRKINKIKKKKAKQSLIIVWILNVISDREKNLKIMIFNLKIKLKKLKIY